MISYSIEKKPSRRDIGRIITLYKKAGWWEKGENEPLLAERIVTGSHVFLTARYEGDIIGMGRAISDGVSDAYIQDVTVDSKFRDKGIGAEIVRRLVSILNSDGVRWIGLIAEGNSHSFYERHGFREMENAVPMLRHTINTDYEYS